MIEEVYHDPLSTTPGPAGAPQPLGPTDRALLHRDGSAIVIAVNVRALILLACLCLEALTSSQSSGATIVERHVSTSAALVNARATESTHAATEATAATAADAALAARTQSLQDLVDRFRSKLSISQSVAVVVVQKNSLLVSVERRAEGAGFQLSVERDFLDTLDEQEVDAVIAHELGHVWVFTHHPFLQTEELANDVALQLVSRALLERVYQKVWQQTGTQGDLLYLPTK